MAPTGWIQHLPQPEHAIAQFPACDDDGLELRDAFIVDAPATVAELVDKPELVNVVLKGCDVAGFVGRGGRADRVLISDTRLRGVTWMDGTLRDVHLEAAQGSDVSLRFSTLRRVILRDCVLPGLDLTEVTFDEVRFEGCTLHGAQFHGSQVNALRIERCDLTGSGGVESLAGASVHPDDLLNLGT